MSWECNACGFEFWTGVTRKDGYRTRYCVCTACAMKFQLPGVFASEIGEGDFVEMSRIRWIEDPTGRRNWATNEAGETISIAVHVEVLEGTGEIVLVSPVPGLNGGVRYHVEDGRCPDCGVPGRLVLEFADGDPCPKCGGSSLEFQAFES